MVLADYYHDDRGYAWATIPTLAKDALLHERRVYGLLAALEAKGHIVRDSGGGRSKSNHYLFPSLLNPAISDTNPAIFAGNSEPETLQSHALNPAISDTNPAISDTNPAISDTNPAIAIAPEQGSIRGSITGIEQGSRTGRAAKPPPDPPDYATLVAKFGDEWTEGEIRERCEEALSHPTAKKRTDLTAYCRSWLRKDYESVKERKARSNGPNGIPGRLSQTRRYPARSGDGAVAPVASGSALDGWGPDSLELQRRAAAAARSVP